MEMAGNAWQSAMGGLGSMASGAGNLASKAPGGGWGAGLMGLSALSDIMGAVSRSQQASKMDALRKQALSPVANEEITRQVLSNLAQFGVSADSGMARQAVAKALADAQLQRVQAASGMVAPGVGSSGAIGNTMMSLMTLAQMGRGYGQPTVANVPATSSGQGFAPTGSYELPRDGSAMRVYPESGEAFGGYGVPLPE